MKKTEALKKNYEFARIYGKGKFFPGKYLVLYLMKNRMEINRLGVSVGKKIGKRHAKQGKEADKGKLQALGALYPCRFRHSYNGKKRGNGIQLCGDPEGTKIPAKKGPHL